jgi:predicted O-methyltransferase YrrM
MDILHSDYPASYNELCKNLYLTQGLPYVEKWSAAADYLQLLAATVIDKQPEFILECGSGLTTLIMARACQLNGRGRVISLENGAEFVDTSYEVIRHYDLSDFIDIIHAPLTAVKVGDEIYQWYTLDDLPDYSFDVFSIDGPPGFLQNQSRYPALPLLKQHLHKGSDVFLDDAARDDEKALVQRWQQQGLVNRCEYLDFERGCTHCVI